MKYYLRPPFIEPYNKLEISRQDFEELDNAQQSLRESFVIEDKYNMLISNYLDLETALVTYGLTASVQRPQSYDNFFEVLSDISRKLINFLSIASLYIEKLPQELKQKTNEEYDENFEYRFMQALRNHSLHVPSISLTISPHTDWPHNRKDGLQETSVQLILKKNDLKKNRKFKATVIKEMPDEVNVIQITRVYIESISKLNEDTRTLNAQKLRDARRLIESKYQLYEEYNGSNSPSLLSAYKEGSDKEVAEVSLILEWDNVRKNLVSKNQKLINLSNKIISNKVK